MNFGHDATLARLFVGLGAVKVLAVPAMRQRAADVGFSVSGYRGVGVLELAGAAGLLVGLAVSSIGIAAAVGLILLLAGAIVAHLRAGDGLAGAAPACVVGVVTVLLLVLLVAASTS